MARASLRWGGALLAGALVVGYAGFAWREAERRGLAAAEAQAGALVGAVAAGVDGALAASRAMEEALAERLLDLATDLTSRLAGRPGAESRTLELYCRTHRLRGAILLDDDLRVVAAATGRPPAPGAPEGPFDPDRVVRLEASRLADRARDAGLGDRERVVLGFGESPFGRRNEFLVAARAVAAGGYLLLRLDASELERFQAAAGVDRVLADAAAAPGISYLAVVGVDGDVRAVGGAREDLPDGAPSVSVAKWWSTGAGERVLDVAVPAPWPDAQGDLVRVGFVAAPVEAVIAEGRRNVLVFTALVLAVGAAGLVVLGARERRTLERETRMRAELEARERFAALGRLAGGVAHEIRSPLNALSMAAQRLPREGAPEDPERRERFDGLVGALHAAVERVDRTVEDFLRMGREPPPPRPADVDVAGICRAALEAECPAGRLATEGPVVARADAELVLRAVANLVRNAREAAPAESVTVRVGRDGESVVIVVEDGGPGIAPEDAKRIFEPFHTRRRGGTGLGLHLARDGVRRCGGDVTLEPSAEGGARFAIRLPGGAA